MVYFLKLRNYNFVVVQSQSRVWCFVTPWTSLYQASRSFTISQSLLKNYSPNYLFSSDFTSIFISILFRSMTKSTTSYLSIMSPWSPLICDSFSVFLVFPGLDTLKTMGSIFYSSAQFSRSVVSDSCNPMDWSMPGFPIHHQLPEFMQTHVHWVGDNIQPSHPLSSPSPPALNLSQHQGLF